MNSVEVFDPAAPSAGWSDSVPLPGERYNHGAAVGADGKLYVTGGVNGANGSLSSVIVFDPADPSAGWQSTASLPVWQYMHANVTGMDGRIYTIGGRNGTAATTVVAFDPADPSSGWTAVSPLSTGRYVLSAALGGDGRLYALGGRNAANAGQVSVERLGDLD